MRAVRSAMVHNHEISVFVKHFTVRKILSLTCGEGVAIAVGFRKRVTHIAVVGLKSFANGNNIACVVVGDGICGLDLFTVEHNRHFRHSIIEDYSVSLSRGGFVLEKFQVRIPYTNRVVVAERISQAFAEAKRFINEQGFLNA